MSKDDGNSTQLSLRVEIKRLMRVKGIKSQADLAKLASLNTGTLSRLMTGKLELDDQHIAALQPQLGGSDELWQKLKEEGEDTSPVIEKYLKSAFEKGNPAYEIEYSPGKTIKIPVVLAPGSARDAGKIAAEFIKGMQDGGFDFEK